MHGDNGLPASPRFGRTNYKKELQRILQDSNLIVIFYDWLKSQCCDENLKFWIEVTLYRSAPTSDKADTIFGKYLDPEEAATQVNVDTEVIDKLRVRIRDLHEIDEQMFQEAQNAIFALLENDCCRRFLQSDEYKNALIKRKKKSNLLKRVVDKMHHHHPPSTPQGRERSDSLDMIQHFISVGANKNGIDVTSET
eukprot:TRINITY_DN1330_c0_g1_i1.p1 TRINITY_DN1330_c0_g1~~TRINITY_DN1330_c0_g1_i1.p1  ORF type:complete len:195 (-),score=39.74 TRINITY_DN1330_c0_g1_i1:93-677(-)